MLNTAKRIMLVEDEKAFAEIVRDYLTEAGYQVGLFHTGDGIVEAVRASPPDLMLLDIMLPGKEGTDICREIREFSDVPIILVTAKIAELDRLLGYDLGADDYICKPVKPREILARVKAVLRRFDPDRSSQFKMPIEIDEEKFVARVSGQRLDLTPMEFRLLHFLANKEGRVFSRDQIMVQIYSDDNEATDRSVDSHIKNLRKKIGAKLAGKQLIHSVYGVGYKFELPD